MACSDLITLVLLVKKTLGAESWVLDQHFKNVDHQNTDVTVTNEVVPMAFVFIGNAQNTFAAHTVARLSRDAQVLPHTTITSQVVYRLMCEHFVIMTHSTRSANPHSRGVPGIPPPYRYFENLQRSCSPIGQLVSVCGFTMRIFKATAATLWAPTTSG